MRKFFNKIKLVVASTALMAVAATVAFANDVSVFDPSTWFVSVDTVLMVGALIVPFITKVFTALGKDWFATEGRATQWLSFAVSVIIGGVGGYMALGYFSGVSGTAGALQAVVMVAAAFLGSNGLAKNERQVAAAALMRAEDKK